MTPGLVLVLGLALAALTPLRGHAADGAARAEPGGAELPRPAEIPGVSPEVLLRVPVPVAANRAVIVSRTTYQPGAHVARHYHTSQIVFYILSGAMGVRDDGRDRVVLKANDSLLITPGTVHEHWNESSTQPLVFLEYVTVEEGQRNAIFVK